MTEAPTPPAGWHELFVGWLKLVVANFVAGITLPTAVLASMLCFLWLLIVRIQSRKDFDFARMLRDDNEKESGTRLAILVSLAFSNWSLMYVAISQPAYLVWTLFIYCASWSTSPAILELAKRWDGRMPWSKS